MKDQNEFTKAVVRMLMDQIETSISDLTKQVRKKDLDASEIQYLLAVIHRATIIMQETMRSENYLDEEEE